MMGVGHVDTLHVDTKNSTVICSSRCQEQNHMCCSIQFIQFSQSDKINLVERSHGITFEEGGDITDSDGAMGGFWGLLMFYFSCVHFVCSLCDNFSIFTLIYPLF